MFTQIVTCQMCAEVILSVAKERGLRISLHEPDLNRDVQFKIVAANRQAFLSAREEWGRRITVSDHSGKLTGAFSSAEWPPMEERIRVWHLRAEYNKRKGLPPPTPIKTATRSRL